MAAAAPLTGRNLPAARPVFLLAGAPAGSSNPPPTVEVEKNVIELFVLGVLGVVALAVCGLFVAGISLALWVVFLPFRILGFLLRGLGFLLALPFMLVFGLLGCLIFGFGGLIFLVPFAPFALIAFLIWRWMRGRPRATVSA